MLLPDWMIEENIESGDAAGKKNKSNFLHKSLRNMRTVICNDRQTEHYARCDGALQKVSPQIKLISMLGLILAVSLSRQVLLLLFVWLVTLLLMQLSRLPVLVMQKRIWGIIPLLTLLFSLPVMLNIFMDGTPLFYIFQSSKSVQALGIHWPKSIFVTRQGFTAAMFLFLRVGISLSIGHNLAANSNSPISFADGSNLSPV